MLAWCGGLGSFTAEDSHVVESCVIPLSLGFLHLCLEPTDGSGGAVAAPWAEVTPQKALALQLCPI